MSGPYFLQGPTNPELRGEARPIAFQIGVLSLEFIPTAVKLQGEILPAPIRSSVNCLLHGIVVMDDLWFPG